MAENDVAEILKSVRRLEIVASRAVNDLFAGAYHSVFRGRGMEFDEVREYQPGDEVRTIDWNVTARAGQPFVKRYKEERELTVMLLVDVSASGAFGSRLESKARVLAKVAAMIAWSALRNGDKVGLVLFGGEIVKFLPPRKGKGAVLRLLREILGAAPTTGKTSVPAALEFVSKVQRRKAVVFLLSDFLDQDCEKALSLARARHDLIAVTIDDPREHGLEASGFATFQDLETGNLVEVDLGSSAVRDAFAREAQRREDFIASMLKRAKVDRLALTTDENEPIVKRMMQFFRMRERRLR